MAAALLSGAASSRRWRVTGSRKRLVVLEFPSVEQAKRWYDSEEYRPLKAMRFKASTSNLILVDGA